MKGPEAPKDPIKKANGFYLIRDRKIFGTERKDGQHTQEIYLDDGRISSAAEVTGNVKNAALLDMLGSAEGFRKAVRAIGVTVVTESRNDRLEFNFIMYGKHDKYSSGTHFVKDMISDGIENMTAADEIAWSYEEDYTPGQIMLSFPQGVKYADLSVKLYLYDAYKAPEQDEYRSEADTKSAGYRKLTEDSLIQTGNTYRINKAVEKAKNGEDVTVAFIGGSITQGAGAVPVNTECYACKTFLGFSDMYASDHSRMHYVKAGIGGTSSELGVVRYERDVLQNGKVRPDIVIVEYAVNDEGDETGGDCYEGLVRKILLSPERPAVILLFSVFANDFNLQDRLIPIGKAYSLPMISIKNALSSQFSPKTSKKSVITKAMFFSDMFHPANTGHTLMADCIIHFFDEAVRLRNKDREDILVPLPVRSDEFQDVHYAGRSEAMIIMKDLLNGSFSGCDQDTQMAEMNMSEEPVPTFMDNWMHAAGNEPFRFRIKCRILIILAKDSGSCEFGKAEVRVDGKMVRVIDPLKVGWTHNNAFLVIRENVTREHTVMIEMNKEDTGKKFTLLGIGYVR